MLNISYQQDWDAALPRAIPPHFKTTTSPATQQNPLTDKYIIEYILNSFHSEKCIYGLFSALSKAENRISPFLATHDYCFRVMSCDDAGNIQFNVSPIYHLGPDYAAEYLDKHGQALDENAIIGLIEVPTTTLYENNADKNKNFSLGIDAGIVFKDSKIPHNRQLKLKLDIVDAGLMATLTCDTQTTSRLFQWEELSAHQLFA